MVTIITGGGSFINVGNNGPFPPLEWPFGGFPTISTDIAIMAIFLLFFLIALVIHVILFFVNIVRGRFVVQFLMTLVAFVGSAALCLRISSTLNGYNGNIYIASQMFTASLEVLFIFANLAFSHQVIRTQRGGGIISTLIYVTVYFLTLLAYGMQLGGLGQTFFTLDSWTRNLDYNLQIWATTWYAVASLIPLGMVLLSSCIPGRHGRASAGLYLSIWILMVGSVLIAIQAWYIAGVMWMGRTNRFLSIPSWMSRAWYYVIIWTIDTIVLYLYIFARVDRNSHSKPSRAASTGRFGGGAAIPAGAAAGGAYASGPWGGAARGSSPTPRKKKRGFSFGKFALGAGGAGVAAMALNKHRKKKSEKEELRNEDLRARSPIPRGPAQAGIPGEIDASAPLGSHPTKQVRGFDTETIPEETEDSDDSLYGIDSSMGTESKRHSAVSPLDRSPNNTPKPS